MKEGFRIKIKESLEFRNLNLPTKMIMEELAKVLFPNEKESYAIKTIYNWNNGKYAPVPSPEDILRISQICGVSVGFLFGTTVLPAPQLLDEKFVNSYKEMMQLLNQHYNVDEHPIFQTANEVWKQRCLK